MESQFENLRSRLIVSCQALENEPLHSSFIMGRMGVELQEFVPIQWKIFLR